MADCLFIPDSLQAELAGLGLKPDNKKYAVFSIGDVQGMLFPDEVIGDFVKTSGVRLEKRTTEYEEIYTLLGYMKPTLKKEAPVDYIDGVGGATVLDPDQQLPTPEVKEYGAQATPETPVAEDLSGLKTKLRVAIAALTEVANAID